MPFSENILAKPFSEYGKFKLRALQKVTQILKKKKIKFAWVRPSLTYGNYDNTNRYLGKILETIKKEKSIILRPGNQKRDLLYVKDLVKLISLIIINYKTNYGILNISPASIIYLKDIPKIFYGLTDSKKFKIKIYKKIGFEYDLYMSNKKLRKFFPRFKFTNLKTGIRETLKINNLI